MRMVQKEGLKYKGSSLFGNLVLVVLSKQIITSNQIDEPMASPQTFWRIGGMWFTNLFEALHFELFSYFCNTKTKFSFFSQYAFRNSETNEIYRENVYRTRAKIRASLFKTHAVFGCSYFRKMLILEPGLFKISIILMHTFSKFVLYFGYFQ